MISLGSFVSGYKGKGFVQKKIYLPIRESIIDSFIASPYEETNCPENPTTIVTFGQSNSANWMTEKSDVPIPSNLYQYDWQSQKCYLYREPLLGANGIGGNVITYTVTKMARNSNQPIVTIAFGVGGTSALNWAYGDLSQRHQIVMKRIKEAGLSPRIFLWHQGEADSKLPEKVYYNALRKVAESTLNNFPESSFGIALATRCNYASGTIDPWNNIRSAQKRVSQDLPKSFMSADSDKIFDLETRPDNCHFSAKGASQLGDLYYESISREMK